MMSEAEPPADMLRLGPPLPPPRDVKRFTVGHASDAWLRMLKPDGPSQKLVWGNLDVVNRNSTGLFRLKLKELPDAEARRARLQASASTPSLGASAASPSRLGTTGLGAAGEASLGFCSESGRPSPEPVKPCRGHRYFDLLMKAHNKRKEGDRQTEYKESQEAAEGAAARAYRDSIKAERLRKALFSGDSSASESEDDAAGVGGEEQERRPLSAYNGSMRIELEIRVLPAPGNRPRRPWVAGWDVDSHTIPELGSGGAEAEEASDGWGEQTLLSLPASPAASEKSERIDFSDELAALKDEIQALGIDDSDGDDNEAKGIPEGLRMKKGNVWTNHDPGWSLGLGGTVFFIPDAERYGHAPSLPPPPPASLVGRGRLKMKPRLPLEISHNRYRDERPFVLPPPPFSPDLTRRLTFEQKVMTLDFYHTCHQALTKLPRLTREKNRARQQVQYSRMVDHDLKYSTAWRNFRHRQRLIRKEELARLRAEREAAEAAAAAEAEAATAAEADGAAAAEETASQGSQPIF